MGVVNPSKFTNSSHNSATMGVSQQTSPKYHRIFLNPLFYKAWRHFSLSQNRDILIVRFQSSQHKIPTKIPTRSPTELTLFPHHNPKQEIVDAAKNASVLWWGHFNFSGEFDFSDEKMRDSIGMEIPKKSTTE